MQTGKPPLQPSELDLVSEGSKIIKADDRSGLELKKQFLDHKRDEEIKTTLHKVFKYFIYVSSFALTLIFLIRMIHLVIPAELSWLTPDQVQGIDKIFFSSAIGGFIASYFNRFKK